MSKDDVNTPESPEVNNETKEVETKEAEAPTEETLADALDAKEESKIPDSIPYNRFKEKVEENNDLKSRLSELEERVQANETTQKEVDSDLADIAKEHDIPDSVLEKLSQKMLAQVDEKLAPLTQREQQAKRDSKFEAMFEKALADNPQFSDIANKDIVKQLAFNPANANLTLSKLLENTYGKLVQPADKKTMETTQPGKSEAITSVDFNRAQNDSAYMKQIKADSGLHAEYKKELVEQLKRKM